MEHRGSRNNAYSILKRNGERTPELAAQNLFWQGWFETDEFELKRQLNNGHGAPDFMVVHRAHDIAFLEFKMADHRELARTLRNQPIVYEDDNDGQPCLAVVIAIEDRDFERANKIINELPPGRKKLTFLMDFRKDHIVASKTGRSHRKKPQKAVKKPSGLKHTL